MTWHWFDIGGWPILKSFWNKTAINLSNPVDFTLYEVFDTVIDWNIACPICICQYKECMHIASLMNNVLGNMMILCVRCGLCIFSTFYTGEFFYHSFIVICCRILPLRFITTGAVREFTFIPVHIKPDDALAEMNSLVKVCDEAERLLGEVFLFSTRDWSMIANCTAIHSNNIKATFPHWRRTANDNHAFRRLPP